MEAEKNSEWYIGADEALLVTSASPNEDILRFDEFELNLRAGELHKSGRKVKLQVLPVRVLAVLLEMAGQVVTREELREKLWPADTFVDFEHSLNTAIAKLRRALNDEAEKPRFIETLPRRGYRFVGSVVENAAARQEFRESTAPATDLVGGIFVLCDESGSNFVSLPVDEVALKEKEKLEAAKDDLGLSLLFATRRVLLARRGTRVKVLKALSANSCWEVRILEGEFTGDTALVPAICLGKAESEGT
ncbi:MAG TPA: transcriptional regulator [Candidatus Acidoferrales bacterium]|nr:transcriptional regulator [Candidatus Acidoferrales bacterium]